MKINKLNIKLLTVALGLIAFSSCTDDDLDGMDAQPKPTATTSTTSLTIVEGETGLIPFTINRAINKVSQFKIEILEDGDLEQEVDYFVGDHAMDADTGVPHVGFEQTVPAYATSFEIPFETYRNLDQTEGTRNVTIRISAAGVRTILTPEPYYVVNVTILDFEYCMWNLDVLDAYGDSWQGATITVTQNGTSEVFPKGDWDDDAESYQIPIQDGADFEFTYTSGTTGTESPNQAGSPGWEEENSYVLTAPDGTVYTDGPIPAVGSIVSGTNNCN